MAVLKALFVAVVVASSFAIACYSPETPDCVLACTADSDCISGQTCTTDHFCAASGITTCGAMARTDGGNNATMDADTGSGSDTKVMLMIHVDKGGGVKLSDNQLCDTGINTMTTDCNLMVKAGQPVTLSAYIHLGFKFDKWDGMACPNQNVSNQDCTVTLTMPSMAAAHFKPN